MRAGRSLGRKLRRVVAGSTFGVLVATSPAQAALLVYEGYAGYGTSLVGVKPSSSTVGLNRSVDYGPATVSTYTVSPTSLPFSQSFYTQPGSLGTTSTSAGIAAAQLSLAASHTGTLYHSYLVRFGGHSTASGEGSQSRVSNDQSTTTTRLIADADTRQGSLTTQGIGYGSSVETGGVELPVNTTYLMIAKWTNVGTTLSAGTPGGRSLYALTSDQFDSFWAAGATESYLDNTAIGSGANAITSRIIGANATSGSVAFNSGSYTHFVTVGHAVAFDELRYGTTLNDVIPEPTSVGLLATVATVGLLWRRRRQSAST